MKITPFRIDIPERDLTDLHRRLDGTRWPDDVGPAWEDGTPSLALRDVVEYWRGKFDWRAAESRLNALPQFVAELDGHAVHFVHAKGADSDSAPLVITHGWPGSFVEMVKILPMLTHPEQNGFPGRRSFDVVVPSLPGFGFSAAPTQPGMNSRKVASLWHELMHGLGYASFFAQGGDIGSGVSTWLARLYPASVRALHLNFISGSYQPPLGKDAPPLSPVESEWLAARAQWVQTEGGYSHMQATKPQTLAHALADSPSGLAGWLLEKFHTWSDGQGELGVIDQSLSSLVASRGTTLKDMLLRLAPQLCIPTKQDQLGHSPSGPRGTKVEVADAFYARQAQAVFKQLIQRGERGVTTARFLQESGCRGGYHHRMEVLPKLRKVVLAFRGSEVSLKQLNKGRMLYAKFPDERVE